MPSAVTVTPPTQVSLAGPVQLTSSTSAQAGLVFDWDFGDGSHSAEASPSHQYDTFGSFVVKLQVSDASGGKVQGQSTLVVPPWPHLSGANCTSGSAGGWCKLTQAAVLVEQAVFPSPDLGYAVADGGLYKSMDRGASWSLAGSAKRLSLPWPNAMRGTSQGVLWIQPQSQPQWLRVDASSLDVKSVTPPAGLNYAQLDPLDANRLLAWGQTGPVLTPTYETWLSEDSGATWSRKIPIGAEVAYQVNGSATRYISPAGDLWRLGSAGVERSRDLGKTFAAVSPWPAACTQGWDSARSLRVVESDVLVVVGRQAGDPQASPQPARLCLSSDQGASWTSPPVFANAPFTQFAFAGDGTVLAANDGLYILAPGASTWKLLPGGGSTPGAGAFGAVDAQHLWIAYARLPGTGAPGGQRSEDGGATWTITPGDGSVPAPAWLQKASSFPYQELGAGVVVQYSKRSTDDGKTWNGMTIPGDGHSPRLSTGAFVDARKGFALNSDTSAAPAAYVTEDGGKTWSAGPVLPASDGFHLLHNDRQALWLANTSGAGTNLLLSRDAGRSWKAAGSFSSMPDSLHGLAGGPWLLARDRTLYQSSDDGLTWTPAVTQPPFGVTAVHAVSATTWWVHTSACLSSTADAGRTWSACESISSGNYWAALVSAGDTVWYLDGQHLFRRGAGGWQALPAPPSYPNDLRFLDARVGWLTTASDGIWMTTDGGQSWERQTYGGLTSGRLSVIDANTVWAIRDSVIGTATGGR